MATTPVFQAGPKNAHVIVADTDTTVAQTLQTAGASGALIDSIAVTSDDTSAAVINVIVNDGSTDYQIGQVTIAAGAGTDGTTAAQNLLSSVSLPFLQTGGGLALGPNAVLKVAANATLTAAKSVTFTAIGGDY